MSKRRQTFKFTDQILLTISLTALLTSAGAQDSCAGNNGDTTTCNNAKIGACYGTLADNHPPAADVIALCNQRRIRRIRLYNPNPAVLQALRGQPISVVVGVANEDIRAIARNAAVARNWVQSNIAKYGNVNFRYIAVGNEIAPNSGIAPSLLPAMRNIYNALSESGMAGKVKVTTALSMGVLGQSYPPSAGAFAPASASFTNPIVAFLAKTNAPFLLNVYPYFAYVANTKDIRLDYALSTAPAVVVRDGEYEYRSLFEAMVDAVHAALERVGGGDVEVVVSETGWPTEGGAATTVGNAWSYNSNLVRIVQQGTPRKPGKAIEAYIFGLMDENRKTPEYEKHWGLFSPDKNAKYPLSFT